METKTQTTALQTEPAHPLHSHRSLYLWIAVIVIIAVASLVLIAIQTFKTDEEVNAIVSSSLNFSHLRPQNKMLAMLQVNGGLCVYGGCYSEVVVYADGSYVKQVGSEKMPKSILDSDTLQTLSADIAGLDYAELRSNPFTGTCPVAYDGREYVFTFYHSTGKETLASCEVTINMDQKPFSTLQNLFNSPQGEVSEEGWKIYQTEKYGFEFKYPPQWILNPQGLSGVVTLANSQELDLPYPCAQSERCITFEIYNDKTAEETIQQWVIRTKRNIVRTEEEIDSLVQSVNEELVSYQNGEKFTRADIIQESGDIIVGGKRGIFQIFGCEKVCYYEGGPTVSKNIYLTLDSNSILKISARTGPSEYGSLFKELNDLLQTFKFMK